MRTYKDFVKDMIANGKNVHQIRTVASSTRWRSDLQEVVEYAKELRRKAK